MLGCAYEQKAHGLTIGHVHVLADQEVHYLMCMHKG